MTNRFILLVILSAIISCDSLTEKDTITPEKQVTFTQSDFYILPGSSIIIDLKSIVKESFVNATLSFSQNPQRGTLSRVDAFLVKYRAGSDFMAGKDYFVLSVISDGKILAKSTITINMRNSKEEFPCVVVAIEDERKLIPGASSVAIEILENDWLCDIDKSSLIISIHTPAKYGQAIVENETIVYTRDPGYQHQDELIYQVTNATGESISYGLVSIDSVVPVPLNDIGEFTIQKIEGKAFTSLFFIDENIGFLGTDGGIYKTADGGINWIGSGGGGGHCSDIFFLNESKGFAVMEWDRIVSTNDGGVTWKTLASFEDEVTNIVFTSETTGFIAVYDGEQHGMETSILKTEDAGVTWRKIFEDRTGWAYTYFEFINPNKGYAVFSERLFETTDAGETWNLLVESPLAYLQVTSGNKFFAVEYTEDGPTLFAPNDADAATLITSDNGYQWRILADLSSTIMSLGFSPAADVGFAVTFIDTSPDDPNLWSISIRKTVDQGETWVEQNFHKALYGYPIGMSVPSSEVVYFLCQDKIIKRAYK